MKIRYLLVLLLPALLCCAAAGSYFFQERDGTVDGGAVLPAVESIAGSGAAAIAYELDGDSLILREAEYQSSINFTELQKKYPDVYAWIRVDGTGVNYPIMQHPTDDSYYLTHSATGAASKAGAVFTETLNSKDFTDPNTVVYGHNMRNGSMFRTLHRFEDRAFFDSHDSIVINTPKAEIHYRIFAAYKYDNMHLLSHINFYDPAVYADYLEEIRSQDSASAFIRKDVPVTNDNCILTLSTCTGDPDLRYIVQAVQTRYIVTGLIQ